MASDNQPDPKVGDVWFCEHYSALDDNLEKFTVSRVTKTRVTLVSRHGKDVVVNRKSGRAVGDSGYWMPRYTPATEDLTNRHRRQGIRSKLRERLDRAQLEVKSKRMPVESMLQLTELLARLCPEKESGDAT